MDKRDGFLQMIEDCRKGLINRIITKSISRFARNITETLSVVRELKSIGVSVYFMTEKIVINGGVPLKGTIEVTGAKNAAVAK